MYHLIKCVSLYVGQALLNTRLNDAVTMNSDQNSEELKCNAIVVKDAQKIIVNVTGVLGEFSVVRFMEVFLSKVCFCYSNQLKCFPTKLLAVELSTFYF